jgi:hypothetical protein
MAVVATAPQMFPVHAYPRTQNRSKEKEVNKEQQISSFLHCPAEIAGDQFISLEGFH